MPRPAMLFVALVFAVTVAGTGAPVHSAPAKDRAAATSPEKPGAGKNDASTWDRTRAITHRQWQRAKTRWARERTKWRSCNRQADRRKLQGSDSWTYIARCMTR